MVYLDHYHVIGKRREYFMKLQCEELMEIKGGALSAALLNAIIKGFESIFKLGQTLGSALARLKSGKKC